MSCSKPVKTSFAAHFKLSSKDSPKTLEETERMLKVPYASAVGSLMYLMVCTRPDIAFAVSVVSRFLSQPGYNHWCAVKWILRYLNGTLDTGLMYGKGIRDQLSVVGYVDADFAKDMDRGRSTSGYVFQVLGCTVSWRSALQRVVALSTTEAEYMSLTEGIKEAIWLKGMVQELGIYDSRVVVYCDNQGALQLSKNPMYHERTKHINVRLHFIRDVIEEGEIEVEKVDTKENTADVLTKALPGEKFQYCVELMKLEPSMKVG